MRNPYRAPSSETWDGWAYASKPMPSLEGQHDCDPQANCMRPQKGRQVFTIAGPADLRCFDDKSLDGWYDIQRFMDVSPRLSDSLSQPVD